MPRDGSGIYTRPPGTNAVPDTTIDSAKYNNNVGDVESDLNLPRPIIAGGTGASSADNALTNLSAEKAKQVVTNWDATTWRAGSYYAASSATGAAPVAGRAFAGQAYYATATDFVAEAVDLANNAKYIRVMTSGVWGPWVRVIAPSDTTLAYKFNSGTTFPPASGVVCFNNAAQNSTTELFMSHLNASSVDITSQLPFSIPVGTSIQVQDAANAGSFKIFTTTAAPVNSGGDLRVTVSFSSGGADLAPGNNVTVSAAVDGLVHYDRSQALTTTQQQTARQNISAAPLATVSYSNFLLNGDMSVSQENGASTVTCAANTAKYVVDQWQFFISQVAATASANAFQGPSTAAPGVVTQLAAQMTASWAPGAAADFVVWQQPVEGTRWSRLGWGTAQAMPVSLGFWVYATVTGVMSVSFRNGANNRSYVVPVSVTAAATWQYKTVTVPGDITGTWAADNTAALVFAFCWGCGATYTTASPNTWLAGPFIAASGQTNFVGVLNNIVAIAGVSLISGNVPISQDMSGLIRRSYAEELSLCRRYWESTLINAFQSPAAGAITVPYSFKMAKRVAPTMTTTTAPTYVNGAGAAFNGPNIESTGLQFVASAASGYVSGWGFNANARM